MKAQIGENKPMKIQIKLNETIDKESGLVLDIDPKVVFQMDEADREMYDTGILANYTSIVEQLTYDYLALAGFVREADIQACADIENPD